MIGEQLLKLIKRTPTSLVQKIDKGFGEIDFMAHYDIIQLLFYHLEKPFSWSVSEPFDSGDAKEPVAVIGTLLVSVDGEEYQVDGIGSDKDAKKAESDALKRAAMKVGLGLELWAGGSYWLDKQLDKETG